MWWGLLALIITCSGVVVVLRGPVAALGCGVLLSFLFPCWIEQKVLGTPIDLRIAVSAILLLVNLLHPQGRISWRFTVGDWALFALYLVHIASDSWQDGFHFFHIVRAFGEWNLPYIAGRIAVQNIQDWRWLTKVAVLVTILCGLWSISEAITQVNIGTVIYGPRPADLAPMLQIRSGFKRAEGPTRHPIWFGMIQMLLLPWAITSAYRGLRNDGPTWWLITPVMCVGGILATLSRGPAIAGLITLYLIAALWRPKWRSILIVAGAAIGVIGMISHDAVFASLEKLETIQWAKENSYTKKVELTGKKHRLTALSYRWLVFIPYLPAIREAGLLGYGTGRTTGFPVNVPVGPDAKQAIDTFRSIDSEYLLLLLRFGWCGVTAFMALCCLSIWRIVSQSLFTTVDEKILPLGLAAALIAVSVAFIVEYMPHDYGFLFLWTCGVANGIRLPLAKPATVRPRRSQNSLES